MREQCSCGAGIVTWRYERVKDWRIAHRCNPTTLLDVLEAEADQALLQAMWIPEEGED
jgi:hypothetical protein